MGPRPKRVIRWRCHACGEISRSYAAAERHADSHGGARIEIVSMRLEEPCP